MSMKTLNFEDSPTLGEALLMACRRSPDCRVLIEADREKERQTWTFHQLQAEAERFAALLQERQVLAGDRCAILMSNQGKWLISATGVFWSGAVLVPLDYKLPVADVLRLLRHSEPKVLITEWPLWQDFLKEGLPEEFPAVFVTEAPPNADLAGARRWESQAAGSLEFRHRAADDVATIVYSSGTGGAMKGCMLSHWNYLSQIDQIHQRMKFVSEDRYFSFLPTNHAIDFVFGFLYPLLVGATVVHQRTLRPQYLLPTFRKYRITVTSMVPALLKAIRAQMEEMFTGLGPIQKTILKCAIRLNRWLTPAPNQRLSRLLLKRIHRQFGGQLRLIMTGGAFIDPKLAQFFYDLGFFAGIGYGLTEAGTAVSTPDWGTYRNDTVGFPLSQTEVRIERPDEQGVGEIWVRGPSVMRGYWKNPELTAETFVDGWLKTGDLGSLDGGALRIKGRAKNMIVTEGGKNIYPEDVESHLNDIPQCQEYCVFSRHFLWPSEAIQEDGLLIVVRPESQAAAGRLADSVRECNRKLAQYKRIRSLLVWDSDFPRTASLKIKRLDLAEQIRRAAAPSTALEI